MQFEYGSIGIFAEVEFGRLDGPWTAQNNANGTHGTTLHYGDRGNTYKYSGRCFYHTFNFTAVSKTTQCGVIRGSRTTCENGGAQATGGSSIEPGGTTRLKQYTDSSYYRAAATTTYNLSGSGYGQDTSCFPCGSDTYSEYDPVWFKGDTVLSYGTKEATLIYTLNTTSENTDGETKVVNTINEVTNWAATVNNISTDDITNNSNVTNTNVFKGGEPHCGGIVNTTQCLSACKEQDTHSWYYSDDNQVCDSAYTATVAEQGCKLIVPDYNRHSLPDCYAGFRKFVICNRIVFNSSHAYRPNEYTPTRLTYNYTADRSGTEWDRAWSDASDSTTSTYNERVGTQMGLFNSLTPVVLNPILDAKFGDRTPEPLVHLLTNTKSEVANAGPRLGAAQPQKFSSSVDNYAVNYSTIVQSIELGGWTAKTAATTTYALKTETPTFKYTTWAQYNTTTQRTRTDLSRAESDGGFHGYFDSNRVVNHGDWRFDKGRDQAYPISVSNFIPGFYLRSSIDLKRYYPANFIGLIMDTELKAKKIDTQVTIHTPSVAIHGDYQMFDFMLADAFNTYEHSMYFTGGHKGILRHPFEGILTQFSRSYVSKTGTHSTDTVRKNRKQIVDKFYPGRWTISATNEADFFTAYLESYTYITHSIYPSTHPAYESTNPTKTTVWYSTNAIDRNRAKPNDDFSGWSLRIMEKSKPNWSVFSQSELKTDDAASFGSPLLFNQPSYAMGVQAPFDLVQPFINSSNWWFAKDFNSSTLSNEWAMLLYTKIGGVGLSNQPITAHIHKRMETPAHYELVTIDTAIGKMSGTHMTIGNKRIASHIGTQVSLVRKALREGVFEITSSHEYQITKAYAKINCLPQGYYHFGFRDTMSPGRLGCNHGGIFVGDYHQDIPNSITEIRTFFGNLPELASLYPNYTIAYGTDTNEQGQPGDIMSIYDEQVERNYPIDQRKNFGYTKQLVLNSETSANERTMELRYIQRNNSWNPGCFNTTNRNALFKIDSWVTAAYNHTRGV